MLTENVVLRKVLYGVTALFLLGNLCLRLDDIWHTGNAVRAVILVTFAAAILVFLYPRYLRWLLFLFGFSFFLYGFHSHSIYSRVFELLVTIFGLIFLSVGLRERGFQHKNGKLLGMLLLYLCLSALSLLQLPLGHAFASARLWGFYDFAVQLFTATAGTYLYSIAAVNRWILFFAFVLLLSGVQGRREHYVALCTGILLGAIVSAVVGLLNYYGMLSLDFFRSLDPVENPGGIQFRLQSTFGHPGWFAEFVTVAIPFILLGFMGKKRSLAWRLFLFSRLKSRKRNRKGSPLKPITNPWTRRPFPRR